jgi:hypothetical protein
MVTFLQHTNASHFTDSSFESCKLRTVGPFSSLVLSLDLQIQHFTAELRMPVHELIINVSSNFCIVTSMRVIHIFGQVVQQV